jgi:lipoate---protein ligase
MTAHIKVMIDVLKYNLPDINILDENYPDLFFKTWQPDKIYLILGQSNLIADSLNNDEVEKDNISVYKRPSGGQTVILSPNTLVLSSVITTTKFINPDVYFKTINGLIIRILQKEGIMNLLLKGISDIAIKDKKILGSAIYRNHQKVFYHAVLNVAERTDLMEKYIKHPVKEPDYRIGRSHTDFVTSLHAEGYKITIKKLKYLFENDNINNS